MNTYLSIIESEELLTEILYNIFFGKPSALGYDIFRKLNEDIIYNYLFLWKNSKYGAYFWAMIDDKIESLKEEYGIEFIRDNVRIIKVSNEFHIVCKGTTIHYKISI